MADKLSINEPTDVTDNTLTGAASGLTNQPDVAVAGDKAKQGRRAVTTVEQMKSIVNKVVEANRERNAKNARIESRYNAETPYTQQTLEEAGLGWKANFTTKPLATTIDKVSPRFEAAVNGLKSVTNAKLPDNWAGGAKKSEFFQRTVTTTIRARRGWKHLIDSCTRENALYGYTIVAWLDDACWFPRHFRQDCGFVTTGTRQDIDECPLLVFKESFQLHEFFAKIENTKAARKAGWLVPNCIEELNKAMPTNLRSQDQDNARVYQDLVRECNVAANFEDGARMVVVYHLLVAETSGKVSHYIVNEKMDKQLFGRDDRFETMHDCAAFYSFQLGNGTMHGSKGIGREIYNMAAAVDRLRCEMVDRVSLSGKVLLQGDTKMARRLKMHMIGNTMLVDDAFKVQQSFIDGKVESAFALDGFLADLLDQMTGNASPKVLKGERVTAQAVNLYAEREEENRDAVMGRFLQQFAVMCHTSIKRLCNPKCSEKDAQACYKTLRSQLSEEEIKMLAEEPAIDSIKDYTETERQQIVVASAEAKGNPLYNQHEIERQKLSATIGDDFATQVLLPINDPTEEAEQTRGQQMENVVMSTGVEVPASPRDNHEIHIRVTFSELDKAIESIQTDPTAIEVAKLFIGHAKSHVQQAIQYAAQGQYDTIVERIQEYEQQIAQFEEAQAQAQAAAEQQAAQAEQQAAAAGDPAMLGLDPMEVMADPASLTTPTAV